jgi:hypothetical protein
LGQGFALRASVDFGVFFRKRKLMLLCCFLERMLEWMKWFQMEIGSFVGSFYDLASLSVVSVS